MKKNPFTEWHSARIIDPDDLSKHYSNKTVAQGIQLVLGKYPHKRKTVVQAIRFNARMYRPNDVKKWISEHNQKVIKYEWAKKNNPSRKDFEAEELHRIFLGRHPSSEFEIDLKDMTVLAQIGKVHTIEYTARKYNDKNQQTYRHTFKKKPLLLTNGQDLIIFGDFEINERGIV